MKIGKIKPAATLVAQFAAGVEVDAIQHEGKMFLPVVGMGDFESTGGKVEDDSVEEVPAKKPAKKTSAKETKSEETEEIHEYTEDELMEMSPKELTNILKKEFEIDPNDYDGKNTNKKLRGLILDAQEKTLSDDDDDDEDTEDDSKEEPSDELTEKVASILEDFDSGAKNKKKTIASICKLSDDADEDVVADLVDKFEEDADADLDKMAAKIVASFGGAAEKDDDDEDEEEEKPSKKSPKSKKKKENLVDVDDLEVGDRVSVWWDDDNQEWFDGEVKSIKKGKVTIAYDDDTEEVIDPEVHTKIKRID